MLMLRPERLALADEASQPIAICGKQLIGDSSGALYWPAERALVVADLHLEKGSSAARRGRMLPPYDTRETLLRLAEVMDRYAPEHVIALGDSFHDSDGSERMSAHDLAILRILQEDRRWTWITGNHDPILSHRLGGIVASEIVLAGLTLRHEPRPGRITHEIAGHLHPAARLSRYGHTIRRPCFIGSPRRLVLPAFGTFTGGLNVLDQAFHPLFGDDGMHVWVLGEGGLYPMATRFLVGD